MSDATCTVGKDGKKYYFVNGKRTTKKAVGKCTPSKAASPKSDKSVKLSRFTPKKEAPKAKKPTKKTVTSKEERKPAAKKVPKKTGTKKSIKATKVVKSSAPKKEAPKANKTKSRHQLFLFKESPVYKIEVGGKIKYVPEPPRKSAGEKLIEELAPYPGEEIGLVSESSLTKDSIPELKTPNYFLLNPSDAQKVRDSSWSNPDGDDYSQNPHDLKIKNHLKYLWEYGNMNVSGDTYPTFIRPVRSYYKLNHIKKMPEVDGEIVATDYNTHRMMMTIAKERGTWSKEQWKTFTNNVIVNGYILSNLRPVGK